MFGFLCINLVGASKILSLFFPISYEVSVFLIILIIIFYVVFAGFRSVVKTDFIQYISILLIITIFMFYLLWGKFELVLSLDYNLFNIEIKNLVGFFLVGIFFPFSQPELFQRVYASKNISVFKKSVFYSVLVYIFFALILTLVSLIVVNFYPNLETDTAFVVGLYYLLPSNINGFLLVILFAAFMSSLDTYIYTASSSIIQNFFKFSKKSIKKYIRIVVGLISLFAILLSIAYPNVVELSYLFVGLTIILGLTVVVTWIDSKVNSKILFFGALGGFIILLLNLIFNLSKGTLSPSLVIYGFIGFLVCFFISWLFYFIKKYF